MCAPCGDIASQCKRRTPSHHADPKTLQRPGIAHAREINLIKMPKKQKTGHVALDDLSWQPVTRTHAAGLDFDEGLLGLEEVVGVQVQYRQTANGRVATFTVRFLSQSWALGMCMSLIRLR